MAESSYGNSIKFYEKMSELQGELRNYESQQFQLEEDFQRLWTQGTRQSHQTASSNPPRSTSDTSAVHFTHDRGHLASSGSQSQLSSNRNYYTQNHDEGRRARNQALLDKLQELETNASIFAARSERLKMMRNEYENLVKKCALNKNRDGLNGSSIYSKTSISTSPTRVSHSSKEAGSSLTSIGVNTDITGEIRPALDPSSSTCQATETIPEMGLLPPSQRPSIISTSTSTTGIAGPLKVNNSNGNGFLTKDFDDEFDSSSFMASKTKPFSIRRPTFPDISSTSESEITIGADTTKVKLKHPQNPHQQTAEHLDKGDETSDTTSLSVLLPKPRFSNYKLNVNVSTDGSLSELTPLKQLENNRGNNNKGNASTEVFSNASYKTPLNLVTGGESCRELRESFGFDRREEDEEKRIINFTQAGVTNVHQNQPEEEDSRCDSTSQSVGDSLMDSVYNKPEDSLPKDEMRHITEVDEDENNEQQGRMATDQQDDKDLEDQQGQENVQLINELRSQMKGNWGGSSSSSNLVRVVQKTVGENVGDEAENNEKLGEPERSPRTDSEDVNNYPRFSDANRKFYSFVEEESKVETKTEIGGMMTPPSKLDEMDHAGHKEKAISSQLISGNEEKDVDESQIPERDGKTEDLNKAPYKKGSSILTKKTGRTKSGSPKKKVHLKLNYDDSESESEKVVAVGVGAPAANAKYVGLGSTGNEQNVMAKMQQALDDEFDDFYV